MMILAIPLPLMRVEMYMSLVIHTLLTTPQLQVPMMKAIMVVMMIVMFLSQSLTAA